MRREKNRNRMKNTDDESETESSETESTTIDIESSDDVQLDDDGQMHSYDSAIQKNGNSLDKNEYR